MAYGDGPDDEALRTAWHAFCDRLKEAGDKAFKDANPTGPLMRADASRSQLLAVDGPEVLHLATHGFFLRAEAPALGDRYAQAAADPLIRSCIALAGANRLDAELSFVGGNNGLPSIIQLRRENRVLIKEIELLKHETDELEYELTQWNEHTFNKEKTARELLQMAKKDEIIYFVSYLL